MVTLGAGASTYGFGGYTVEPILQGLPIPQWQEWPPCPVMLRCWPGAPQASVASRRTLQWTGTCSPWRRLPSPHRRLSLEGRAGGTFRGCRTSLTVRTGAALTPNLLALGSVGGLGMLLHSRAHWPACHLRFPDEETEAQGA